MTKLTLLVPTNSLARWKGSLEGNSLEDLTLQQCTESCKKRMK